MPNSEDYTVVWVGVHQNLDPTEISQAEAGVHPLVAAANSAGLNYWLDVFENTPDGDPVYSILIGEKIDVLGYKEGRSLLSLSQPKLNETFERVSAALGKLTLPARAELHILLHIED
jgi:hypothetical protein